MSAAKRWRPALDAYADDADPSPLQYVSLNEGEVRTTIKVLYVKMGAPPEREWWGNHGTIKLNIPTAEECGEGIGKGHAAPHPSRGGEKDGC